METYILLLQARPSSEVSIGGFLLYLFLIIVGIIFVVRFKHPSTELKHSEYFFDGVLLSASEFYKEVKAQVSARAMPGTTFSSDQYVETHILSATREYLRISRGQHLIDIGCTQFGNGSYVSWRLAQYEPNPLARIPILNTILGINPKSQSYFQRDTAIMFHSVVNAIIQDVISSMTTEKGVRQSLET